MTEPGRPGSRIAVTRGSCRWKVDADVSPGPGSGSRFARLELAIRGVTTGSTVRAARGAAEAGLGRRTAPPARRDHRRGVRVSDAVRPGGAGRDGRRGIRVLPDSLD